MRRRYDKAQKLIHKDKTTSRNVLLHLMRRFQERHGIILSAGDMDEIKSQLNRTNRVHLYKNCEVFKILVRSKEVFIVRNSGTIKTVLPKVNKYNSDVGRAKNRAE